MEIGLPNPKSNYKKSLYYLSCYSKNKFPKYSSQVRKKNFKHTLEGLCPHQLREKESMSLQVSFNGYIKAVKVDVSIAVAQVSSGLNNFLISFIYYVIGKFLYYLYRSYKLPKMNWFINDGKLTKFKTSGVGLMSSPSPLLFLIL